MQDKANDVVTYQLLQHRREMEEMLERIQKLKLASRKKNQYILLPIQNQHMNVKRNRSAVK